MAHEKPDATVNAR